MLVGVARQQKRGVKTIDFAGSKEDVYGMISTFGVGRASVDSFLSEREDWPKEKLLVS